MREMPYIKKIEITGFKSFGPRRSTILLDKGFTVITGPNGSGKTNLVDAILFGLGELSAKRLRAENFSKLIFDGSSAGSGKAKKAKVLIQFDNSDGLIPIDSKSVTISREVDRSGQSIYRLNGKRVARSHIVDLLSISGIAPTGYNLILQGTVTRLADLSPVERRKIIEDLVGISQYDAEKAEAEEKLKVSEISLKTAMGRIDEVQKRIDSLEKERNDLLRYRFIQKEIKRLEALKYSHEIRESEKVIADLSLKVDELRRRVEELQEMKEKLRSERSATEKEWRRFSSEVLEEGGTKVLQIQMKIGELRSLLSELTTKINANKTTIKSLIRARESHAQKLGDLRKQIEEARKRIREIEKEKEALIKEIEDKEGRYKRLSEEASQIRSNLTENSRKARELETQLNRLYETLISKRRDIDRRKATERVLVRRLADLNSRRERLTLTLEEFQRSVKELESIRRDQEERLKALEEALERKLRRREGLLREISEAGKVAETAREAVIEFDSQRKLADKVADVEASLRNIEELGELGIIKGVYGRLKKLIKTEKRFSKAIEAAAGDWLNSMVVKDIQTAFTCAETLKRLKLSRIKIIPLEELKSPKILENPPSEKVVGVASSLVKFRQRYKPAVDFIFGDTLVAKDLETAFDLYKKGFRTVTLDGDLYEPEGGIESGYYRTPIDFTSIIPSEEAIKSLGEAVEALRRHLLNREEDIASLDQEIEESKMEITRLSEAIKTLKDEVSRILMREKSIREGLKRLERDIQRATVRREKVKEVLMAREADLISLRRQINVKQRDLNLLRAKIDPATIQNLEMKIETLREALTELRAKLGEAETESNTLKSKLETVFEASLRDQKTQIRKIDSQRRSLENELEEALKKKEKVEGELRDLEKEKEKLSKSVLNAREEAEQYSAQLGSIDEKLSKVNEEYDRVNQVYSEFTLNLQKHNLNLEHNIQRLREIGYEEPIEVDTEDLEKTEATLQIMRLELERLGAINQLAAIQYDEQIGRYKELSLRLNELEKEKQAIISFMREVESKKRRAFLEAFDQINENFKRFFSQLTGGGEAYLQLENVKDPFQGGIDMIVQFPDKPSILVAGASGGERSVAAVAFIFAIQEYSPTSFYLLDEIDAHLDAFHTSSLGDLLGSESMKSQFLVITLKPEMVNKAEKIYGVYMRNGISHVISTTIKRRS